jgi:DNA-binding MarR family transcriptional regulator
MTPRPTKLRDRDYERLLSFRDGLRRFLHWSEEQAQGVGVTAAQYQLLLAVRGHPGLPSITDVADHLLLRHHSVVELVHRAERAGLVERSVDPVDQRVVRLRLTAEGDHLLEPLVAAHIGELSKLRNRFDSLWDRADAGL